jgi:hypothetical protein
LHGKPQSAARTAAAYTARRRAGGRAARASSRDRHCSRLLAAWQMSGFPADGDLMPQNFAVHFLPRILCIYTNFFKNSQLCTDKMRKKFI